MRIRASTLILGCVAAAAVAGPAQTPSPYPEQATLFGRGSRVKELNGTSVAMSGDTALVGAIGANGFTGAAYVFSRAGTAWEEQAKLVADGLAGTDFFGASVALSGDIAIVGARATLSSQGAAYVFRRDGATWTREAKLVAGDGAAGDSFGTSVAADGDTVVVGAPAKDGTGAVYVFTRSGTTWTQQWKLVSFFGAAGDGFGNAVSLDGDTIAVGASQYNGGQGDAHVFERSGAGWSEAEFIASGAASIAVDATGGTFTITVDAQTTTAIAHDATAATVQAALEVLPSVGAGLVVVTGGPGAAGGASPYAIQWSLGNAPAVTTGAGALTGGAGTATVTSSAAGAAGDHFGSSIALSGGTVVVGAYGTNNGRGAAYVFTASAGEWRQQARLAADDAADFDQFGTAVTLVGDVAVVGAPFHAGTNRPGPKRQVSGRGAAFAFRRTADTWTLQGEFVATSAVVDDQFGASVALSGGAAIVGAPRTSLPVSEQGAAYVFTGFPFAGISGASSTGVSAGASLRVAGAGFGAKPKAWLDRAGRKIALKSSSGATDTQFDAVLVSAPKGAAGACTLNVQPRGARTWFTFGGFTIDPPAVDKVAPPAAPAGARVTISGRGFGAKKGKALLGGKSCKVAAWHDTWVDVVVPAGLASGPVDVKIDAGVGSATATGAFGVVVAPAKPFAQQDKLTEAGVVFHGYDVAADGDTLLVGAPDDALRRSAAFVYVRSGSAWVRQAKLVPPDAAQGDRFGFSVALHGDTAVIGAYGKSEGAGAAYVFRRTGAAWSFESRLIPTDDVTGAHFGASVAVSGDTALVGAPDLAGGSGMAYFFHRSGATWTQQASFLGGGAAAGELNLGGAVAIRGERAVVGAYGGAGSAYVYDRSGGTWSGARIVPNDPNPGSFFGGSVDVDGDTVLVGALAADGGPGSGAIGAAYVFTPVASLWSQQAKLVADDAANNDYFGTAVALQGDTALIGAYVKDGLKGGAYAFRRSAASWTQSTKLLPSDSASGDYFGLSVVLSGDAAFVSAPFRSNFSGAVYAFAGFPFSGVASARPASLAAGASIVVSGAGFGSRPQAWLDLGGRKIPLKVEAGAADTQFRATLARVPPGATGSCTLNVLPKGAKQPFTFGGLAIQAPTVAAVSPSTAPVGAPVTISGSAFGPKTGAVTMGGKPCVVLSWHDTWIEVVVPAGMTPGPVDVSVSNGLASGAGAGAFVAPQ